MEPLENAETTAIEDEDTLVSSEILGEERTGDGGTVGETNSSGNVSSEQLLTHRRGRNFGEE